MRVALHRHLHCASQGRAIHLVPIIVAVLLLANTLQAAPQTAPPAKDKLTLKERNCQTLPNEMVSPYLWWVSCEVRDIIPSEEASVFKGLRTDDEREEFITQFWERRNPEPGSLQNRFKRNYYRRIVRANEAFSATIPGWRTDRGRIYIRYGPPDEIESHPHGGTMRWSEEPNGSETTTYPFERWFFRVMEDMGANQVLIFVDPTGTGDFRLTMNPTDRDELLYVPGLGSGNAAAHKVSIEPFLKPSHPPAPAKFPDLRAIVNSGEVSPTPIPLLIQSYAFPATDETVLTLVAVQLPKHDLQFQNADGLMRARVDVYGQFQSLGGHIVAAFEKNLDINVSEDDSKQAASDKFVFEEFAPVPPGRYRISLAVKDEASGRTGVLVARLVVPVFYENRFANTPVILADSIEPNVPPAAELDPFVIGNTKVLPNPGQVFSRESTMGVYLQIYNLGLDPETHKTNFRYDYEILKDGKPLIEEAEKDANVAQASTEFTIVKTIPLKSLKPGAYSFQIKITDNVAKQTITPATVFSVR